MTHRSKHFRQAAARCAVALALAAPVPAVAQQQTFRFDIPAQSLDGALRAFARASRQQILFDRALVADRRSGALVGTFTLEEGFERLLAGTGLRAARGSRGAYVIGPVSGEPGAGGAAAEYGSADEEVVVTGTRIRGAPPIAPTTVETREQIERRGIADLGGFARALTQNFTGGQNPGVLGGGGQGGSENLNNSTALNLRGLGPDATLTLVNGHRLAYDGAAQGVDISAIPLLAVDRIDVVTDGASALYGSDAVGGVANVILRRDFEGALASVRLSAATDGGAVEQRYGLLAGQRWTGGGIAATVEYVDATPITARQRSYTRGLYGGSTILPGYDQISAVVTGHQQLTGGVTLELDAQFADRQNVVSCASFNTVDDCRVNGADSIIDLRSYAISPTLRIELPVQWQVALTATHGRSDTRAVASNYAQSSPIAISNARYDNRLSGAEATAEGPLFALPGGDARLAVGGGLRALTLKADVRVTRNGVETPFRVFTQRRDVYFAYGEVSLPLVGPDNAIPLVHRFQVNGALRYESTESIGDVATPKLGILYMPHRDLSLSATWGRSFKAPTLTQLAQLPTGFLNAASSFIPPGPGGLPVITLQGGNGDLGPERARTWTATLAYTPGFAPGLRLSASYYNIRYRGRVITPIQSSSSAFQPIYQDLVILNPTVQQVLDAVATLPGGLTNQTTGPFDPAAVGAIINNSLQNAALQSIQGVDLAVDYSAQLSAVDRVQVGASASYLTSEQRLSADQPLVELAGTLFDPPRWRSRGEIGWERGNFGLTGVASYIGGVVDDRRQPFVRIDSFTSIDLTARLRTSDAAGPFANIGVTLSVLNLFNEKPDLIRTTSPTSYPFDSTNYPSIGRTVSLTITKQW